MTVHSQEEGGAMTCKRCKGLMVNEWRPDFSPETFVWRCINCGSIIDPLIAQNRSTNGRDGHVLMEPIEIMH
jgi:hypothetical protein